MKNIKKNARQLGKHTEKRDKNSFSLKAILTKSFKFVENSQKRFK